MRFIISLALFTTLVRGETQPSDMAALDDLLVNPSLVRERFSYSGVVFLPASYGETAQIWSNGLISGARIEISFEGALRRSARLTADFEMPYLILPIDIPFDSRILYLKRESPTLKKIRQICKKKKIALDKTEEVYQFLAEDFAIDALITDSEEIIVLKANRFHVLNFIESVLFYGKEKIGSYTLRLKQVEFLATAACEQNLKN